MAERVVISPTTRNEGHGKFVLEVDGDGIVKKGHFMSTVLVRGFEKFLSGRDMEFAPVATSRFCGLCPPTHASASCEAVESSIGLEPPASGRLLRELCNIGNHLHDHPLQQILVLPDFVKDPPKQREALLRIQRMRRIGQHICGTVGGEAVHCPYFRIGGMEKNISEAARRNMEILLGDYTRLASEQRHFMEDAFDSSGVPKGLGDHGLGMMATDLIYGSAKVFIDDYYDGYSDILPLEFYGKDIGRDACTIIPLIKGKPVEVGPRARLARFAGYRQKGCMAINLARLEEIDIRVSRARQILKELKVAEPTYVRPSGLGDGKMGIGVNEAPRGTNIHMAWIDNGRIIKYKAMPATMWNIPVIGKACEGFHHRWAEWVMRAYDPCISCATHVIVIKDGKLVEERQCVQETGRRPNG